MKGEDDSKALLEQLKSVVSSYLDIWVSKPSLDTVTSNIIGQDRIASLSPMISILLDNIINEGVDIDTKHLSALPPLELKTRIEVLSEAIQAGEVSDANKETIMKANEYIMDGSSRKFLMGYLVREYNWTEVSPKSKHNYHATMRSSTSMKYFFKDLGCLGQIASKSS
ncbi:MAG: hypothetical protein HF982_10060, partial [Desulfobacteraceae bacterium]|nr:hypothetical protein [Desulfobacteraceae bacterium]MBC2719911.1 hypothetical protein [Desulfobacteraceae bacterium]